jgi:peroxiredoxin
MEEVGFLDPECFLRPGVVLLWQPEHPASREDLMRCSPIRLSTPFVALSLILLPFVPALAQAPDLRPVTVGSPMPDFTLPIFQGGNLRLSDLKGKNVLIVFPRGLSQPDSWCHVCPYQHAELVEYEEEEGFQTRANLEVLFVLPYSHEMVEEWIDAYPQLLRDIEDWKNPPNPGDLDDAGQARVERMKRAFPKTYSATRGQVPNPFPILVDAERVVSQGLGLFSTDWGGSTAEQNIPTVLIIDAEGVLQFKYMSQNTLDRPPLEYLVRVVDILNGQGD